LTNNRAGVSSKAFSSEVGTGSREENASNKDVHKEPPMPVVARVDPRAVFTSEEWSRLTSRSSLRGMWLVVHAWGTIAAAIALVTLWPNPLTWLIAVTVVGARQLGLAILMHEAATHANAIERLFIAPYWVNYHAEHHLFMYLPCYRLPEAHRLLIEKGLIQRMEVRPGYLDVMRLATSSQRA
jgi:fatty acid desaturase